MAPVELASRVKMTEKAAWELENLRADFDPDAVYADLAGKNIRVLTLVDAGYPGRLREIPDPPPALFVSGEVPDVPAVALVGSRKASRTGLECARALGGALGERGVCVVSGLALGVDAAAHEGALEAGGPTVGVLGCGIDIAYPPRSKRLPAARRARRGRRPGRRTPVGGASCRPGVAPRRSARPMPLAPCWRSALAGSPCRVPGPPSESAARSGPQA